MSTAISWENIPSEIWLQILEKLPIKSQVSLGCTCKKMYQLSLDPFLANLKQRTWVYLENDLPLPDLLARAITVLRIPSPDYFFRKDLKQFVPFLHKEIRRMSNLQKLILEKQVYNDEFVFSFSDLQTIILEKNLTDLRVPKYFFTSKATNQKTLFHLAVKKENLKLVNSLAQQMEIYFEVQKGKVAPSVYPEINVIDEKGNTPLKIAIEKENEELILLLVKKGARGKEYLLSRENTDLSPITMGTIDKGSHLQVDYLNPSNFSAFFEAVAASSSLLSLGFSTEGYREIKQAGLGFFQSLAEALQNNFQRYIATLSEEDLEGTAKSLRLLVLDLRDCKELTIEEVTPFLTCQGLEELWLPTSTIDYRDEREQNLLHLLVQERSTNTKIAGSLIAQGVTLTSRDHKGRTPIELARELSFQSYTREMTLFLELAARSKLDNIAFGKKDWEKYYGKVGKEPPLPEGILDLLESPCSIWPDKKVQDTHFLTLIPETVNGKSFTLNYLDDLVQNPRETGNKTGCRIYDPSAIKNFGSRPSGSSYWALMTKDLLPCPMFKSFDDQWEIFLSVTGKAPKIAGIGEYKKPTPLEAATSILMEYVRSGRIFYAKDRHRNLPLGPHQRLWTWYSEMAPGTDPGMVQPVMCVGHFDGVNLSINEGRWHELLGLAGLRVCFDCKQSKL